MRPGRLSRRRLLRAALPAALALAACRPPENLLGGPVLQFAAARQIKLVVPVPDKLWADRLAGRVRDYQDQTPNVTVDLRPVSGMPRGPFDVQKWAELLEALATGGGVDATVGWDTWAPNLIDAGLLRPLDPYLIDIGKPIDRFFMSASVRAFRRYGRVWMLPWQAQPVVTFFNKDAFDAASLRPPEARWTWRDLETMAGPLTKVDDKQRIWGFDVGTGPEPLIYQNGGRIVDDPVEPTRPTLDDPANVETVAWLEELTRLRRVIPAPTEFRQFDGRMGAFASGQIAMRLDRMGVRGGNYAGSPRPWGVRWGVLPPLSRITPATTANFQSWGIVAGSTQVDDTWRLVRHLCTKLPAEARIDGIPALLALQDAPDLSRLLPEGTGMYMRALAEAIPAPASPVAASLELLLAQALQRVALAQVTPAEALRDAQQTALHAWKTTPARPPAVATG